MQEPGEPVGVTLGGIVGNREPIGMLEIQLEGRKALPTTIGYFFSP